MGLTIRATFVLALLAHVDPAVAQQTTPRDVASNRSLAIRGRVISDDMSAPLRRVRIALRGDDGVEPTFTDDEGRFQIVLSGPAEGGLRITKAGFAPLFVSRPSLESADADFLLRMVKAASISGLVMDRLGAPAVGVRVRMQRTLGSGTQATTGPSRFTTETDDLGEFRVGNLPAGRYEVWAGAGPPGRRGGGGAPPENGVPGGRGRGGRGAGGRGAPVAAQDASSVEVRAGQDATIPVVFEPAPTTGLFDTALEALRTRIGATAERTATGVVRGRVLTADSIAVKGVTVQLTAIDGGGTSRSAVTDANGRYEMTGVSAGRFRLRASKTGFAPVEFGQTRAMQQGRTIAVADGQRVQGIDVKMPRASVVTGTLVDAWGEPVESARMQVWQSRFADGRTTLSPVTGVLARRTDDRGYYRLYGLLPGTYYVAASIDSARPRPGPGGAQGADGLRVSYPGTPVVAEAATVQVGVNQDAAGVDMVFRTARPAQIRGRAMDSMGQPARGRAVLGVSERSGALALPLQTAAVDSDGSFEFDNVSPGDYVVQVISVAMGPLTSAPGAGRVGGTAGGGRAAGQGGGGRGGVGRGGGRGGNRPAGPGGGQTRASGPSLAREFGVQFVSVTEGDVASVTVETAPGSRMTGQIVLEGDVATEQPGSFGFAAYPADRDSTPLNGTRSLRAVVQEEGAFEMTDVFGAVRFAAVRAPEGWWLKSVNVAGVNAVEDPAVFSRSDSTSDGVTVVFASGAGGIGGRVVDDRSQPASEFSVVVFSSDPNRWFSQSPYVALATPSQDGTFSVSPLPPAEYYAAAVDRIDGGSDFGDWQNPDVLSVLASRARRMTVRQGQQISTELRLIQMPR